MRSFLIVAIGIVLSSCATGLSQNTAFDSNSEVGLLIIGLSQSKPPSDWTEMGENDNFNLRIRPLKEDNSLAFQGTSVYLKGAEPGVIEYKLFTLPAGTHVFANANRNVPGKTYTTCLNKGTFKFNVRSGDILYLGNAFYEHRRRQPGSVTFNGFSDIQEIEAVLKGYPNVRGRPQRAELIRASVDAGRGSSC